MNIDINEIGCAGMNTTDKEVKEAVKETNAILNKQDYEIPMYTNQYIHYGHTTFDKDKFQQIRNVPIWVKPSGGLWASATDARYGWKDWCEEDEFRECTEENSFIFHFKQGAKVFLIDGLTSLNKLPRRDTGRFGPNSLYLIDFEQCLRNGIDAIELMLYGPAENELYWALYGWDCDSVLVMNPDCIEVEE